VLSTGQQFRCNLARAVALAADPIVFDEFTSVVDRTVAQIGSAAVAREVRRRKLRFVAVTCHEDVEWLQQGPGKEKPEQEGWTVPVKPILREANQTINVLLSPQMQGLSSGQSDN
jgi:hypothetical protein